MTLEQWKKGIKNLENVGIKTIKMMGGEPTVLEWLPELIEFITKETDIKVALLSNSTFTEHYRRRLQDAGLYGYFASVDCLEHIQNSKAPVYKSNRGYEMLKALKQDGKVPLLASNVVINKYNIKDIPLIVEALSKEGYWVNLCTIQNTDNYLKHFSKTDVKKEYLFTDKDKKELTELSDTLIDMKRKGFRISVPYQYLKDIPLYGIHSNWQCKDYYQLRIDSDGALMLCNEFRMKKDEFFVENLDKKLYINYMEQWYKERNQRNCDGCYWSCFVQAKDNIENAKLEFHYMEDEK